MKKIIPISIFGIAFGLLEAIVVVYLHQIIGPKLPVAKANFTMLFNAKFIAFVIFHKPILATIRITTIEMLREASTIIMLMAIAYISGENIRLRLAAFMLAFGFWDLFYYVFLKALTGWPNSLFSLDVYFLIPVAWIGPVITPIALSICIIVGGGILLFRKKS